MFNKRKLDETSEFMGKTFQAAQLKVSQFRNVFLESSILLKNERKQFYLRFQSSKVEYYILGIPLRGLLRRFARYVRRVTSEVAVSFLLEVVA